MGSGARSAHDGIGETLRELAVPRLHGSPEAERVAIRLRTGLERIGYRVEERAFEFSALPGRHGAPLLGALLAATLPLAAWLVWSARPWPALVVLLVPALLAVCVVLFSDLLIDRTGIA